MLCFAKICFAFLFCPFFSIIVLHSGHWPYVLNTHGTALFQYWLYFQLAKIIGMPKVISA